MSREPVNPTGWQAEDLSFGESAAQDLEMSIRIGADGLSFLAVEKSDQPDPFHGEERKRSTPPRIKRAYIPFPTRGTEGLKAAFFANEWLAYPFAATYIYLDDGGRYALIPDDLSEGISPEEWLSNISDPDGHTPMSLNVRDERMTLAYAPDTSTYEFCARSFSYPRFEHRIRSFIGLTTTLSRRTSPKVLVCIPDGEMLDVLHAVSGKLLLANRYTVRTPVDSLYFITALWRHFSLDPGVDPIYLYATRDSELRPLVSLLEGHIRNIRLNEYPGCVFSSAELASWNTPLPPELILDRLCE